jgi:hypothetical protein
MEEASSTWRGLREGSRPLHLPAWQSYHKTIGMDGDVGIWHETYVVQPGRYEAIYGGMPLRPEAPPGPWSTPSGQSRKRGSGWLGRLVPPLWGGTTPQRSRRGMWA